MRARRELHEHRHGAVGLRARRGEEAVGDLALHHHAPRADSRHAGRGSRRRSAWRCCTAGSRRASSAAGRGSPRSSASASPPVQRSCRGMPARCGLERAVELDRVDVRDALGEVARQDAEARARPRARRRRGRGRRGARSRRGCSRRRGSAGRAASSARRSQAERGGGVGVDPARRARPRPRRGPRRASASVCMTFAGSLGLPRTGCGARYGLSVSASMRSAGTRAAASRSSRRLRVGDVAGERDVPAALERRLEQRGRREAVEDDGAVGAEQSRERVLVGVAGVDHDRLAELGARARAGPRRGGAASSCGAYSRK